jgi:hypothetical protein
MLIKRFSTLFKYHILLGLALNFVPQLFIAHVYVFFLYYLNQLMTSFQNEARFKHLFLVGFLYFPLCEAVGRLHSLDPFIPWEMGKYMAIFFVLILVFSGKMVWGLRSGLGVLLILTTLINGNTTWKLVFFNAVIAYCVMLMSDYFKSIQLNSKKIVLFLRYTSLPLITFLFSSISKLNEFKPETVELGSRYILDEIPSNQIATYMGLGFFIFTVFIKLKVYMGIPEWQKLIYSLGLLVVGVISFSRGGILVGLLGVFALYFESFKAIFRFRYFKQLTIIIPLLIVLTLYLNNRTNGNLLLRYKGETIGTLAGSKEKNINTLTTNRYNIMLGDINTFFSHPVMGVETGRSMEKRKESGFQYSHVEFSRLLSEHGLVGLIVTIIWFIDLFKIKGGILKSLYVVGFLTTLHGATRTALPLVLMLISMVNFTNLKLSIKE